jgi:predicted nucleic acid-binding protein
VDISNQLYVPGLAAPAEYNLGPLSAPVNGAINLVNAVPNLIINGVSFLTAPIERHQGELITFETTFGPGAPEAMLATTGIATATRFVREAAAVNGLRAEASAARGAVVLDTNAVIAAVERGESARVLGGRTPLVPITAAKEFIAGGGSSQALRSFLGANGGRIAAAGSEASAAGLRAQATGMGRALGTADWRIAASAVREGAPVVTNDSRFARFLRAVGIAVGGF